MTLPTQDQAFGQQGSNDSAIYYWPENSEVIASAARFNNINKAIYGFIKQLEGEHGAFIDSHESKLLDIGNKLVEHLSAIQNRYTKAEADAINLAITAAVQSAQAEIDNLNSIYETDAEAAAALSALSAQWNSSSEEFRATVTGWLNDRYTKAQADSLLAGKATVGASYTKAESDSSLSLKANAAHNHLLSIGNGSVGMITVGSNERIDLTPGAGIKIDFDDYLNKITVATDLAADFSAANQDVISTLRGGVQADGDTMAKLRGLISAIQTVLTSDDVNLDTLQEVVTKIKSDEGLIASLTSGKVNVSDIVNTLDSTDINKPLSAAQGTALKVLIDSANAAITTASDNRYTKAQADSLLAGKATVGASYTKAESDSLLAGKATASHGHVMAYKKSNGTSINLNIL